LTGKDGPGAMPVFQVGATVNLNFRTILPCSVKDLCPKISTIQRL
jgi:hypothetical protein